MTTLDKQLASLDSKKSYKVDEIISDLFNILFLTLHDLNTPLRENVFFHAKIDTTEERLIFKKPCMFIPNKIQDSSLTVNFQGRLKKNTTGSVVQGYIRDILGGYILYEKSLFELFKLKTREMAESADKHGVILNPDKGVSLLNGCYHSNKFEMNDIGEEFRLSGSSGLTIFL